MKQSQTSWKFVIFGLMVFISIAEFSTPAEFIVGYLYTAPILLASARLHRSQSMQVTAIAMVLTLMNIWIPEVQESIATIVDRVITAMALLGVGYLSDRNRYYQEAIAQQRSQLKAREQLMQLREDFTSTLTHDLKTPLLGAIETLKAFQQGGFGPISEMQSQVIGTMTRSHQNSLQLLATLLDIYRNDAEGLTLNHESVDLTGLAEETVSELLDLAMSRRIHLSFRYGESDVRRSLLVQGDKLQLQRVFSNLLINAINHSRRGDRVEINLMSEGRHQVVKILDGGSGLQAEEMSQLFERFYQGQGDRQAKGTGLGLYLSRQIIEAHRGTIWAENRSPTGALFGFRLPVSP